MFRRILIPVDLAELDVSARAFDEAVALARASDGEIRLINIQSLLPATFMDYVPTGFDQEQKTKAEAALAGLVPTFSYPADKISTVVRIGGVYPEILAEAEGWNADLIVIGSHRPAMSTYLLGSNAKTVVRHAKCSVLVIRP